MPNASTHSKAYAPAYVIHWIFQAGLASHSGIQSNAMLAINHQMWVGRF